MITKLDIMLDPESYDGAYTGDVTKVVVGDDAVKFSVDFEFNGTKETILAEISFTKGLNRSTKMMRESGIKKIDELKNVKRLSFNIDKGWINITGLGDTATAGATGSGEDVDTSRFMK